MTDHNPPRHYLREGVLATVDILHQRGVPLPFELKRRDAREPGRTEKERFEDKIYALVWRQFRKQRKMLKERFEEMFPERKNLSQLGLTEADFDDPEFIAGLMRFLTEAAQHGINLFAENEPIGIDYTLTNSRAADWARENAGELIRNVNQTTIDIVRKEIATFVETPGMTIGDVVQRLPFNESRAFLIATDQITKTYAAANQMAGEQLKADFPDVKVIDQWFTNYDDKVCPLCRPMDGQKVELGKPFIHPETNQEFRGPGDPHPGCRCWDSVTTQL